MASLGEERSGAEPVQTVIARLARQSHPWNPEWVDFFGKGASQ